MRPFFNQDNLNIRILDILEQQNNCSYTELTELLKIDRATVTKAIKQLTHIIDQQSLNDIKITLSNQGIDYHRVAKFNLAALLPMLTDQRTAIIFESSFNEHYSTISSLANKIYVSESTTRRLINLVNDTLIDYRIQIDPKSLHLIGPEPNIRYAAFQYYWNTYGSVTWPFFVNEEEIKQNSNVPSYDKLRFSFWLAICKQRQLKQHHLEISELEFIDLIRKVDFLQLNKSGLDQVKQYCHLFGNVPLLYDRQKQLDEYLQFISAGKRHFLFTQANHQKLLALKLCELSADKNLKEHLKFSTVIDSDFFNRQQLIQQLVQYFNKVELEVMENQQQSDFILTNLTLRNSKTPTLFINVPLNPLDYEMIGRQIKEIVKKI